MNYEVDDYRKPPPKPEMGEWPLFVVPKFLVADYIFKMMFCLFGLPALFGFVLTVTGFGLNFLLVDIFIYLSYKKKINEMWGDE